jgi:hypothetical protein
LVTLQKKSCSRPAIDGSVTCAVMLSQPLPLQTGACATETMPIWRTPASGTFTVYSVKGGALQSVVPGKKAPASAPCDCTSPVAVGSSTYCPLVGGNLVEVTLCQKR